MNERVINGYENYSVDVLGNIKNISTGTILTHFAGRGGYHRVDLYNGSKKTHNVAKLVAEAFLTKSDPSYVIDHINGNINDNRLCNLRYCTRAENNRNRKVKGYFSYTKNGRQVYQSSIMHNRRSYSSKCFEFTNEGKQKALKWRVCKEIELFGNFSRRVCFGTVSYHNRCENI